MALDLAAKLDPRHTALVIVDVQNDFCHADGAFGRLGRDMSGPQGAARQTQPVIDLAHRAGVPVIFIQTTHSEWTDGDVWTERHLAFEGGERLQNCREGSWGAEFYHLAPEPRDRIVTKHRYSAFLYTDLELIMRCKGVKTIVATGVATETCVHATVRDGFMRDFHVVVLEDCCGSFGQDQHAWGLQDMAKKLATVTSSHVLGEVWAAAGESDG